MAAFEKVFLKKASNTLREFSVFFSGIIVVQFFLIFLAVARYKLKVRARRVRASGPCALMARRSLACAAQYTTDISPGALALPKWKFLLIGVFDTIAGVLMLVSISRVDGSLAILLLQGVVVFSMGGSALLLGHK